MDAWPVDPLRWAVERQFPSVRSLGIYNRRLISGTTTWSQHSWANAWDIRPPESDRWQVVTGTRTNTLDEVHEWLVREKQRGTTFWGRPIGTILWRVANHYDHIHVESSPKYRGTPPLKPPLIAKPSDDNEGEDMTMLGLDVGRRGEPIVNDVRVGALQAFLVDAGFLPGPGSVDGAAGDVTRGALNRWKGSVGITSAISGGEGRIGNWEYARMLAAGSGSGVGVPGPPGPVGPPGPPGPAATLTIRGSQTIGA